MPDSTDRQNPTNNPPEDRTPPSSAGGAHPISSEPVEPRRPTRPAWLAILLPPLSIAVVGFLFGLPTLSEPFGDDQGIYAYIADRLLEGAVDHRDVFDHKPPGIHFFYAKAFFVFGRHMWSIWLADLLAVILTGWGVWLLGRRLAGPRLGWIAAILFVVYYQMVGDWLSRAQPETFLTLAFVWSLALTAATRNRWALFAAGFLLGVGFWFKPTIVLLSLVWVGLYLRLSLRTTDSGLRRIPLDLAVVCAGGLATFVVVLGYYALNGALGDLYEALIVFNMRYHTAGQSARATIRVVTAVGNLLRPLYPLTLLAIGAVVATVAWAPYRATFLLALGWMILALGTVFWQGSFAKSHYIPALAPFVLLGAIALDWLAELIVMSNAESARQRRLVALVALVLAIGVIALNVGNLWQYRFAWFVARATGNIDRATYCSAYEFPGRPYSFNDLRQMAAYIQTNTDEDDPIYVWGFRPLIAWMADRRMPTRFVFRYPLTQANKPAWWSEFLSDLRRSPPVFFIVCTADRGRYHPTTSKEALMRNEALRLYLESSYERDQTVPGFEIHRLRQQ